jgi:hypothetical protein
LVLFVGSGQAPPVVSYQPVQETPPIDNIQQRRSSRSRTKSPEPVRFAAQNPALSEVPEEDADEAIQEARPTPIIQQAPPTDTSQMYEKILDEMEVDEDAQDVNEDELLAEPEDSVKPEDENITEQEPIAVDQPQTEDKPVTDDENRGTKRRSDSPTKGNTPKKRQRLPPPNIEDFVNDEDEPELDENSLQLSWCK